MVTVPLVIDPDTWNDCTLRIAAAASRTTCWGDLLLSVGAGLPAPHAARVVAPTSAATRMRVRLSRRLEVAGMGAPSENGDRDRPNTRTRIPSRRGPLRVCNPWLTSSADLRGRSGR